MRAGNSFRIVFANKGKELRKIKLFLFFGAIIGLIQYGCSNSTEVSEERPAEVSYSMYRNYSYKGQRANSDTTFYYFTDTREGFDSLYFHINDIDTSATIPEEDFVAKKIVSLVKFGNDYYRLSVESIGLLNDVLLVKYKSELITANMTWTAAIPLIITVEADFKHVRFYENENFVKEINL